MNEKLKIFATAILGKTLSATAYGRTDETQDRRGTDGRIPRVRPHQTRAGITVDERDHAVIVRGYQRERYI